MASNYNYGYGQGGAYSGSYVTPGLTSQAYSGQAITQTFAVPRSAAGYEQTYAASSIPTVASYGYANRAQGPMAGYGPESTQYPTGNAGNTAYSGGYGANSSTYTNTYSSVVSNYASALYSQQSSVDQSASAPVYTPAKQSPWSYKKNKVKPQTSKVQQVHYCETCKISCAGPQTYKEHLEGQRHKKKEAAAKSGIVAPSKRGPSGLSLRCELCEVSCTGSDAYAAHIRGAKHQKVVKLHTKLGKPIPSDDPVVVNQKGVVTKTAVTIPQIPEAAGKIKVLGTPRINFIGGGRLHTTGVIEKDAPQEEDDTAAATTAVDNHAKEAAEEVAALIEMEKEFQPVGVDYIEENKGDDGKNVSFFCKLCECKFNDPNAKEMHLKGRRHRLQYKKKVDPTLVVENRPSTKSKRSLELKERRFQKQRDASFYWKDWYAMPGGPRYAFDSRMMGPPHMAMGGPPRGFPGPMMPFRRGPSSVDDCHIMHKHSQIVPREEELDEIHHVVVITERALKLVSDKIAEEDAASAMNEIIQKELGNEIDLSIGNKDKAENGEKTENELNNDNGDKQDDIQNRSLKGLMRIGPLAKSLLLSGDKEVDVAVICSEKPTRGLLQRIVDLLPKQIQAISSAETFEIFMKPEESGLEICTTNDSKIKVNVTMTSPAVRESLPEGVPAEMVKDPKQMLDRQKCLDALSALRHTKWYQARVSNLYPCPITIRLMRDLCRRLPTWSKLSLWSVELLCERVISSAGEPLSPGEAFRHVLEAVTSGLILPGGAGLLDPCERDPTDALTLLSRQDREDITASAQHALRLIAFRQIHKVLGIEPLPSRNRKRKHDVEADDGDDPKKEKKDLTEDLLADTSGQQLATEAEVDISELE